MDRLPWSRGHVKKQSDRRAFTRFSPIRWRCRHTLIRGGAGCRATRSMTASRSRISETRPSPRMLAPDSPGIVRKFFSSDLSTTSCMPINWSTRRPMVVSPFWTTTTVRLSEASSAAAWAVAGRSGTVARRRVLFASPAEDVAQGDQRDDLLADLDGRPALDPVDLAGPDLDDLVDVVQRDRVDLVVDPHQQAGHDRQRQAEAGW